MGQNKTTDRINEWLDRPMLEQYFRRVRSTMGSFWGSRDVIMDCLEYGCKRLPKP